LHGASTQSFAESLRCVGDDIPLSNLPVEQGRKIMPKNAHINPQGLYLKEGYVARLVPERIMSVAFFPSSQKLLAVVGDKRGHLGFWDVHCEFDGRDGVHLFKPHASHVSGIAITPFSITKVRVPHLISLMICGISKRIIILEISLMICYASH
jgi:hypothetical protein